ncbi:MAG: amidohydrolase family protein [Spirochaetia bacterium]
MNIEQMPDRIIDMHTHVGEWQEFHRWETEGDFPAVLDVMNRCNIEKIVLFVGGTAEEEELNNSVFRLAKKFPDRVVPFAGINPHYREDLDERMERYLSRGKIRGIKIHPSAFRFGVTERVYDKVFSFASRHKLIVISHTWQDDVRCDPGLFVEISESYPGLPIILGHSGGVGKESAVKAAKKRDELYLELCTSLTYHGSLEWMLSEVGDHRFLFGSDLTLIDPRTTIGWITGADISGESKKKIFYENAKALLDTHPGQ